LQPILGLDFLAANCLLVDPPRCPPSAGRQETPAHQQCPCHLFKFAISGHRRQGKILHLLVAGEDMDKGQYPEHHGGFPSISIEDTVRPGGQDTEDKGSTTSVSGRG
jgi:hypothetical protein